MFSMATLQQRVKSVFKSLGTQKANALVVMVDTIEHMAQHRDWDAAAHILAATQDSEGVHACYKRLIRFALDKQVSLKTRGVKHSTGYEFSFSTKGTTPLVLSNRWAQIAAFTAKKAGYDNAEMHDLIRETFGEAKAKKAYDVKAAAKRAFNSLVETGDLSMFNKYRAELNILIEAEMAERRKNAPKGADVIEIDEAA
jgi:hypothetical protein